MARALTEAQIECVVAAIPGRLLGRTDLGRECAVSAVVAEACKHMRRRDPVGDAVVDLHQNCPPVVRETVNDPAFPQRTISIEAPLHDLGDPPEQSSVIARTWQCRAPNVMGDVEIGVVDPLRSAEIERLRAQDLPEPWTDSMRSAKPVTSESKSGIGPARTDMAPIARLTLRSESSAWSDARHRSRDHASNFRTRDTQGNGRGGPRGRTRSRADPAGRDHRADCSGIRSGDRRRSADRGRGAGEPLWARSLIASTSPEVVGERVIAVPRSRSR